jgi:hypothetical protein
MIVKYDYVCNQCARRESNTTKEPVDWLHGSMTPYPMDKSQNPTTNHDVHLCSWDCASAFATKQFSWSGGIRGMNLTVFERDKT